MADLDYQYLAKIVIRAQAGDSDAFAELYAATYQKQYRSQSSAFSQHYSCNTKYTTNCIKNKYRLLL